LRSTTASDGSRELGVPTCTHASDTPIYEVELPSPPAPGRRKEPGYRVSSGLVSHPGQRRSVVRLRANGCVSYTEARAGRDRVPRPAPAGKWAARRARHAPRAPHNRAIRSAAMSPENLGAPRPTMHGTKPSLIDFRDEGDPVHSRLRIFREPRLNRRSGWPIGCRRHIAKRVSRVCEHFGRPALNSASKRIKRAHGCARFRCVRHEVVGDERAEPRLSARHISRR